MATGFARQHIGTDMSSTFSERHGYKPKAAKITVREDSPYEFRGVLVELCYKHLFPPKPLRSLVCRVLRRRPDENNYTDYPNVDGEIRRLVDDCEWYRVYDIVEAVYDHMNEHCSKYDCKKFEKEINDYFVETGIGWQLVDGKIEFRGDEGFESIVQNAHTELSTTNRQTASNELHEAIADLSRRPQPDVTGAIQHAIAALECVARDVCRDQKANLGDILKKYGSLIPAPLDESVKKAWGYASENARHIREGREPSLEEAELIVGIAASVATYLAKKADTGRH